MRSARRQTAAADLTISAPAARYARSSSPLPTPASLSISTWWPWLRNAAVPAGVSATRFSSDLISLGTPTIIIDPDFNVGTNGFAESGFLRRAFFSAQDRFDENGLVTARSAISNQETAI